MYVRAERVGKVTDDKIFRQGECRKKLDRCRDWNDSHILWMGISLEFDKHLSPDELELARLIITTLGIDINPESIDPEIPIYGDGLGLDSIDILEISMAISKAYGFRLSSDESDNTHIFSSLRNLNVYVQQHRARD